MSFQLQMRQNGQVVGCNTAGAALSYKKIEKQTQYGVTEHTLQIINYSDQPVTIERAYPFELDIMKEHLYLQFFTSQWVKEFTPVRMRAKSITLEGREGRSSCGLHPMLFVTDQSGGYELAVVVAWSGNWKIGVQSLVWGTKFFAGMDNDSLEITLAPGECFTSPRVLTVQPLSRTLDEISACFQRWFADCNGIKNPVQQNLPVEWNHWWSYEDHSINEEIFLKNCDAAAEIGCEAVVLDAGWFGETALWYVVRGDYEKVNTERFPNGLRYLSDYAHEKGLKFGLWCEVEALGIEAELAKREPGFMARRDGTALQYVCFGNPRARQWAFELLDRMITEYQLDWIKLDFNLEPCQGCNRTDHGHERNDGLYRHYLGYFDVLDRLRAKHPHVVLENCGSGGLRIDHEILRHTHATFVSDCDETLLRLRQYSALFTIVPPSHVFTWMWSYTLAGEAPGGPLPSFNPENPKYSEAEKDFHIRVGMLGWFGMSHKLMNYGPETRAWFKRHIAFYKETVKPYVLGGIVHNLGYEKFEETAPRYFFQYHQEAADKSLVFVFNVEAAELVLPPLKGLAAEKLYCLHNLDTGERLTMSGAALSAPLALGDFGALESAILEITVSEEQTAAK